MAAFPRDRADSSRLWIGTDASSSDPFLTRCVQRLGSCTTTRPTRSRATISFIIIMPAGRLPISSPITARMRCGRPFGQP